LREARQLAEFYAPVFRRTGRRLRIMPSPFLRTCQTCQPLAEAMGAAGASVVVHPDIYETGGVYKAGRDAQTGQVRGGRTALAPRSCGCPASCTAAPPAAPSPSHPRAGVGGGVGAQAIRVAPGECLSAAEIAARFEGYDVSRLPPTGPWYTAAHEVGDHTGR
jgi:hypothetical protein